MRALITLVALIPLVFCGSAFAVAYEDLNTPAPDKVTGEPGSIWAGPTRAVLFDNGPLITHPGGGFGGADASALQTALGMSTYGFGHQILNDNRIADDFTVPAGETWDISTITFFAYQTGASTTSTITGVHFEIWDGIPGVGTLVFGDMATNRLVGTQWTGIYRVLDTDLTGTLRAIMANTCSPMGVLQLPAGDYWLAWQTDGTLSSGPWAPPVTILGQINTGNGMQAISGGAYAPVIDSGSGGAQGFPFIIEGTGGPVSVEETSWSQVKALYR